MSFSDRLKGLFVAAFAVAIPLTLAPACGGDDDASSSGGGGGTGAIGGSGGAGGTGGGTGGTTSNICILNNCSSDGDCAGCSDGRTKCKQSDHRCVACDPATGQGCPAGQACTSYGTCAPTGQTCPQDANAQPTVTCKSNSDCAACDPMHQICDTTQSKCVACTEKNTSQCSQTDICVDNKCSHKCPDSCTTNNDCMRCVYGTGTDAKNAKACYNHKCAECSDTYACPAGFVCQKGTCIKPCGIPGQAAGTCNTKGDCEGCGDPTKTTAPKWDCKLPINGGLHGVCSAPATGCSDLGQGAVLPPPYDKVTNLCSSDTNCAGVGIEYNVGELVRDLVGGPEIDVFGKKIKIQDSIVKYGMPKCASINLINDTKCGVCVPCKVDSDCQKIDMDKVSFDLFKGDPLVQIAGKLLLELLYGSEKDHSLHFQCLNIAAGYGVCMPCANPLKACGQTTGGNTGACDHKVCEEGGPLKASCDTCAAEVCKNDSYCCTTAWDGVCKKAVDKYCPNGCGGTGTTTCDHTPCTEGKALSPTCSACTKAVCDNDAFCCTSKWDAQCVTEAKAETACASACGTGCAHSECATGGPLTKTCSTCATNVCNADNYCCTNSWDSICVGKAKTTTGCTCP